MRQRSETRCKAEVYKAYHSVDGILSERAQPWGLMKGGSGGSVVDNGRNLAEKKVDIRNSKLTKVDEGGIDDCAAQPVGGALSGEEGREILLVDDVVIVEYSGLSLGQ